MSNRVYVGNLAWSVSWQDLKDHMRDAGDVQYSKVLTDRDGRSKGCGIVEFSTVEGAQDAIEKLTDTELKGRKIFVREDREDGKRGGGAGGADRPPREPRAPRADPTPAEGGDSAPASDKVEGSQLFIGNLSWDTPGRNSRNILTRWAMCSIPMLPWDVMGVRRVLDLFDLLRLRRPVRRLRR